MMTIITLLCIVILLLASIIALMVTGWPGRDREEIERSGNALRREMAEHRSESIQLLHAIRIKVEDSVKESIEREMAGYGSRGGRSRGTRKTPKAVSGDTATMSGAAGVPQLVDAEPFDDAAPESDLAARQLPLFGDHPVSASTSEPDTRPMATIPATPPPSREKDPEPELPPQTIFVGYIDDIPDVD